ncbi:MAG: glycosyltransferase family 4 protein [Chloroflexota bacterium]|nr:glycosyltransferase family 4 protein [Chloroflexota bacterium]
MSGLRVLMITQKVDLEDDLLGFAHTWVNELAGRVAHLYVLALAVGRHELRENVTLYSMGKERGAGRLRRLVNFTRVVAPLVLRRRVDVVFVHMIPLYAILAAPWTKLARVPLVMWYTHKHVGPALRVAHALVNKVVTASEESFRLPSDKVVVTGHGIDTEIFKPLDGFHPERPFTVLSVGRLSPIKDYETLIEAADILVNRQGRRDLRFVVVGDAGTPEQVAYRERLLAEVRQRGLEDSFEFVGAVPHERVAEHYQEADVFVNLSHTDSLDKAVLEAMACGVVPITSNPAFEPLLGMLAPQLMFAKGDALELVNTIEKLAQISTTERQAWKVELRTLIVRQHSVRGLMDRLQEVIDVL